MPKFTETPVTALKALMGEYQISTNRLAREIKLSHTAVAKIVTGQGRISPSMALRLAKFFATTPGYWIDMQSKLDLAEAAGNPELARLLKTIGKASKPAPLKKTGGKAVKPAGTARGASKARTRGKSCVSK
ncbi:MAG: HigA family addiction module antidote protein [Treponema sp.]|jgi:addiction module HigA family antidote|nr:HigA family addiction module antidote protein [Treponema sp.]